MGAVRRCVDHGIPIVSNFGAANPRAAARRVRQIAREEGISQVRVAVVEGDELSDARGREFLRRACESSDHMGLLIEHLHQLVVGTA